LKQKPKKFVTTDDNQIGNQVIAIVPDMLNGVIEKKTIEFYDNFSNTDIASLYKAAEITIELERLKARSKLLETLRKDITNALKNYEGKIYAWLEKYNDEVFLPEITKKINTEKDSNKKRALQRLQTEFARLDELETHLNYENFVKINKTLESCFLKTICKQIILNDTTSFVDRCLRCVMNSGAYRSP
jgi:hypothetical protein